jgi:3-oxoacyl-[acyl-carrier protein] reductase
MSDNKGKVAIVTGSSRGIGRAIAEQLASEGYSVVCCATSQEGADKAANAIAEAYKTETLGIQVDVSQQDSIDNLVSKTIERFSRVDVLVNNAGITQDNLMLRMKPEEWTNVISVNLNSVFYASKAVMRPMLKQKFGRIISITSVVGLMGNPGQANYAASKSGVIGFTKSVAKEVSAKGITVNAVAPGFIETDMIASLPKDYLDNIIKDIPIKRLGRPEDIAHAVSYLASDNAQYVTGQVLTVDGGIYM